MSPLYYGGTDCPTCGATIPQDEPCQICALRAQLTEKEAAATCGCGDLFTPAKGHAGICPNCLEALLAEKDREIDRLKAAKEATFCNVRYDAAFVNNLQELLSASQAREREAVEELAEWRKYMGSDCTPKSLSDAMDEDSRRMTELLHERDVARTALAAARKALEDADQVILSVYSGPSDLRFNNDADLADFHQARKSALERINGEAPDGADNNRSHAPGEEP